RGIIPEIETRPRTLAPGHTADSGSLRQHLGVREPHGADRQTGVGGRLDRVQDRQVPRADALPALLDGFDGLELACRGVPVLDDVTAREEVALAVGLIVENRDRHVPFAHPAVDDYNLTVLDAIARGHLPSLHGDELAHRMVVGLRDEPEPGSPRAGAVG